MSTTTTITIDGTTYTIPSAPNGDPLSRFALPDGRVVRVKNWIETYPMQVGDFEIETVRTLPLALPTVAT